MFASKISIILTEAAVLGPGNQASYPLATRNVIDGIVITPSPLPAVSFGLVYLLIALRAHFRVCDPHGKMRGQVSLGAFLEY